jgi:ubiquinol-cytochrome c reductase cytochrome c1 subunit
MTDIRQVFVAGLAVCVLGALAFSKPADEPKPPAQTWSFQGVSGRFDHAAAQRGLQVYAQSCAMCHSMNYLHYRDLAGIGLTEDQIKAFAAKVNVPVGIDNRGNRVNKPATPASMFRAPFVSEEAARDALNGSLPPDLSLIVDTYAHGPDELYAILTGYSDPPANVTLADGMSYNKYFPGGQIAMPPPINEGQFTYTDGTVSTPAQNAHDVVTFLAWAADPDMGQRKHIGGRVVLYFIGMAGVTYALKRKIWAKVEL